MMHVCRRPLLLVVSWSAVCIVGPLCPRVCLAQTPTFTFSVEAGPSVERDLPKSEYGRWFDLHMTTEDNPDAEAGAQGWGLSISTVGVLIDSITTDGTIAASVEDDPPGLQNLGFASSYVVRWVGEGGCLGRGGAVSSIVLSFAMPITLPAAGTQTVARIYVVGEFPPDVGASQPVRIEYVDECLADRHSPQRKNLVTWHGQTVEPVLQSREFELQAIAPEFLRGDANDDGRVDLSDPILILGCKFLGGLCPSCRDAADANDDGTLDVSDPVYLLNFLFLGGDPPLLPGPARCGPDPTDDALPACDQRACRGIDPSPLSGLVFTHVNAQGFKEYLHRPTGIIFVRLPGGRFAMGSPPEACANNPSEEPVHEVTLSPFLISKYEVTQGEWKRVMGSNPSYFREGNRFLPPESNPDEHPVERVDWYGILEFESRTGLRLPTEAEWEYACRGGSQTAFSVGSQISTHQVNFDGTKEDACSLGDNHRLTTLPVDALEPNGFGLHHVHGNVAEWCADRFDPLFYASPEASEPNPVARASLYDPRVVRGGSWFDAASVCRSAARHVAESTRQGGNSRIGFRLAFSQH